MLNQAIDKGINFVDTADCYGDSEEKIGKALSHRRRDFYLATKVDERDGPDVRKKLERTLRNCSFPLQLNTKPCFPHTKNYLSCDSEKSCSVSELMRSRSNPVLVEVPLQSKVASFTGGNEDSSECETDLSPDPLAFGVKQKLPAFVPYF